MNRIHMPSRAAELELRTTTHVILLTGDCANPSRQLVEALEHADVPVSYEDDPGSFAEANANGTNYRGILSVVYEVRQRTELRKIQETVERALTRWPGALVIACKAEESEGISNQFDGSPEPHLNEGPDTRLLKRLGFHAVAENPAHLRVVLDDLAASGESHADSGAEISGLEIAITDVDMPRGLSGASLRKACNLISSLHFQDDHQRVAAMALAGLGTLIKADRYAIYLHNDPRSRSGCLEPVAVRYLSMDVSREESAAHTSIEASSQEAPKTETLLSCIANCKAIRGAEKGKKILALPLFHSDRLLGALELRREGSAARAFSARDCALLSALAVPLAAALVNSRRIAEAVKLSQTDDLTRLYNARYLRQFLTSEVSRARRYKSHIVTMFLDVDNFKDINDRRGHLVGSHVLIEISSAILAAVRETDVVARYGGDEFVVILPETGLTEGAIVAERVRSCIAGHSFTGGQGLRLAVTASFGIAGFPDDAESPEQLIALADSAMYEAKAARKNCVRRPHPR